MEKEMATHSSILAHGGRSLVGYSPWGRKESDMTEQLHFTLLINTPSNDQNAHFFQIYTFSKMNHILGH